MTCNETSKFFIQLLVAIWIEHIRKYRISDKNSPLTFKYIYYTCYSTYRDTNFVSMTYDLTFLPGEALWYKNFLCLMGDIFSVNFPFEDELPGALLLLPLWAAASQFFPQTLMSLSIFSFILVFFYTILSSLDNLDNILKLDLKLFGGSLGDSSLVPF